MVEVSPSRCRYSDCDNCVIVSPTVTVFGKHCVTFDTRDPRTTVTSRGETWSIKDPTSLIVSGRLSGPLRSIHVQLDLLALQDTEGV